jgi:hypothetical protein
VHKRTNGQLHFYIYRFNIIHGSTNEINESDLGLVIIVLKGEPKNKQGTSLVVMYRADLNTEEFNSLVEGVLEEKQKGKMEFIC